MTLKLHDVVKLLTKELIVDYDSKVHIVKQGHIGVIVEQVKNYFIVEFEIDDTIIYAEIKGNDLEIVLH